VQELFYLFFYKILYTTYYYYSYICGMEKTITKSMQRRLDRNAKINDRYKKEMANEGRSSAVIAGIAKSYRMTIPTVYSILKEDK